MTSPRSTRTTSLIYTAERQALIEMAKADYLTFRSTRLNLLFDYLREVQGYRSNSYTKYTQPADLRAALVSLFYDQGDT